VHCGACTAVCPSRALTMNGDKWTLTFDHSKCLICELCVKACPLKAMDVNIFV
jgi:ferredoxin